MKGFTPMFEMVIDGVGKSIFLYLENTLHIVYLAVFIHNFVVTVFLFPFLTGLQL